MPDRYPAIPAPMAEVNSLYHSVKALKELAEMLTGQRGSEGSLRDSLASAESSLQANIDAQVAAEAAARESGDQWVRILAETFTGVGVVDVDWTGGVYRTIKAYIDFFPVVNTTADMYVRIKKDGAVVAGASDYYNQYHNWESAGIAANAAASSIWFMNFGGTWAFPSSIELTLEQSAAGAAVIGRAYSRTLNGTTAARRGGNFDVDIQGAGSVLDGLVFGVIGATPNITGRITLLGLRQ